MFKFNHLLLTVVFCVCGMISQAQNKITLDEAIEIALSESNTIKIAEMTIEKTGYAQKGAYASLYPSVLLLQNVQAQRSVFLHNRCYLLAYTPYHQLRKYPDQILQ